MERSSGQVELLRRAIEIAYTSGVTRILDFAEAGGGVKGRFLDGVKLFDFEISPEGVAFRQARPKRTDGYLIGYLGELHGKLELTRFDSLEDWGAYLTRLDAVQSGKGPDCKVGQQCGDGCVKKGYQCRLESPQAKAAAGAALNSLLGDRAGRSTPASVLRVERKIRMLGHEEAYIFDGSGKQLLAKKGTAAAVEFSPEDMGKMKNAIVTHNHPPAALVSDAYGDDYRGGGFSLSDMYAAAHTDMAEMRAIAPEGTHVLRRPAKGWPKPELIQSTHMKASEALYPEMRRELISSNRSAASVKLDHDSQATLDTINHLKLGYDFKPTAITARDKATWNKVGKAGKAEAAATMKQAQQQASGLKPGLRVPPILGEFVKAVAWNVAISVAAYVAIDHARRKGYLKI